MACMSGSLRVPAPGTSCTTVPRYDGWLVLPSGSAAATMRDCRPSAHSASSWSPDSTTMRCGSARTVVVPAAWRTSRSGGPGSSAATSAAQDSSGLRWLPSTPAPAILVVLVTTDCSPAGALSPPDPQLASVTTTATTAAVEPATTPARRLPISTSPTVTSGHVPPGSATPSGNYDRL